LNLLPFSDHKRIRAFYHLSDRKLALGSQLLQRLLISRYCLCASSPPAESSSSPSSNLLLAPLETILSNTATDNNNDNDDHQSRNTTEVDVKEFFQSIKISRQDDIPGGRPVYKTLAKSLEYNVSHHGSLVAIVSRLEPPLPSSSSSASRSISSVTSSSSTAASSSSTSEGKIGVDVVYATDRPRYVKPGIHNLKEWVAGFEGVFTPLELQVVEGAYDRHCRNDDDGHGVQDGETAMIKALYKNWALKEAFVKAKGTGLVTDLVAVEFRGVEGFDDGGGGSVADTAGAVTNNTTRVLENTRDRFFGVEVYISSRDGERGIEKWRRADEWYMEIERIMVGEVVYYLAVAAADAQGINDEERNKCWEFVDYRKDILSFAR